MTNISDPDMRDLDDPPSFDMFRTAANPTRLTLADQIRQIAARLRDTNEYDRQRLCDIAAAVAKREQLLDPG